MMRLLRHPSGRNIVFADEGDCRGAPFFFFNGLFGSSAQGRLLSRMAAATGVRLIAVNRSGVGGTDFHQHPSVLASVTDVLWLADELGIERFGVIGVSAGAAYAMACAVAAPFRTASVTCVGAIGPLSDDFFFGHLSPSRQRWLRWVIDKPRAARALLKAVAWVYSFHPRFCMPYILTYLTNDCAHLRNNPILRRMWEEDIRSTIDTGDVASALPHDIRMLFQWGFDPAAMPRHIPVLLYHPRNDTVIPIDAARVLARRIDHAAFVECDGGHADVVFAPESILHASVEIAGLRGGSSSFSAPTHASRQVRRLRPKQASQPMQPRPRRVGTAVASLSS